MNFRFHPARPIRDLGQIPSDFWDQDRMLSGRNLDRYLGQNIPFNSKSIDRTEGADTFISHKSTDLRRITYQTNSRILSKGKAFVRALMNYTGETRQDHKIRATYYLMREPFISQSDPARRVLEWYLPKSGVRDEQMLAVQQVVEFGASKGIEVRVFKI